MPQNSYATVARLQISNAIKVMNAGGFTFVKGRFFKKVEIEGELKHCFLKILNKKNQVIIVF